MSRPHQLGEADFRTILPDQIDWQQSGEYVTQITGNGTPQAFAEAIVRVAQG